jgi:hypothetical protein
MAERAESGVRHRGAAALSGRFLARDSAYSRIW